MVALTTDVRVTGPLFDGVAAAQVPAFIDAAVNEVAKEGAADTQALGWTQWRNPTGFYASNIVAERVSAERARVWDSFVIYGPWLEGVGSRNATSRFKGYATFRMATQRLQAKAGIIAVRALKPFLARMN